MIETNDDQIAGATKRSRPCAHCGRPVTARRATGRPPRYCPPEERDCQVRARAERLAVRAGQATGGPAALRQITLDLAGQIDEAWEPVQELAETVRTARDLLGQLQRELVERVEQAERAAETATAAKEEADRDKTAAEAARDAAADDARAERAERDRALRVRDEADTAKRHAELTLERVTAERDAAHEQARQAATTATATVAAITAASDRRVHEAVEAGTAAREQAAGLRTELTALRERLAGQEQRLHAALETEAAAREQIAELRARLTGQEQRLQAAERLRAETAQRIEQITADADRKVEQARAETTGLRTRQEDRVAEYGRQLGAQTERADRLRRDCDRYERLLSRVAETVTSHRDDEDARAVLAAVSTIVGRGHDASTGDDSGPAA